MAVLVGLSRFRLFKWELVFDPALGVSASLLLGFTGCDFVSSLSPDLHHLVLKNGDKHIQLRFSIYEKHESGEDLG